MTDKDKIKFAIRYLKQGLKSKRTLPLYEELMKELGFVKKVKSESCCQRCALPNDLVGSAWCTQHCQHDNRFKRNKEFAELNDKLNNLSSVAEVRLANWQKLDKELKAEKEYSATLRKEIDEYTNSHTLCVKYKELEKAYNETEKLLDKQIEATYKVVEENKELKEKLKPENCLKLLAKDGYIKFSSDNLTKAKELLKQFLEAKNGEDTYKAEWEAEQFLKECE